MYELGKIADAFDRWHALWEDTADRMAKERVEHSVALHGVDSPITQGTVITAGLFFAISNFVGGFLQGMVDVTRIGQGVRKGTVGGFAQDGLRLLSLAGPAARLVRHGSAYLMAGNQVSNSCVMTSNAFALRLSATRLRIGIDELARAGSMAPPTTTVGYGGQMAEGIKDALGAVGARVLPYEARTVEHIEKLVNANRGPVVFAVNQYAKDEIVPLGAHAMTAFRSLTGRVMVADQYGIRPLLKMGELAEGSIPLADIAVRDAYIIENALVLRSANALSAVPGVASTVEIAVKAFYVPAPSMVALDDAVRTAVGRPTRAQEAGGASGAAPAGSVVLTADAIRLLALIPPNGEVTRQAASGLSGLDADAFRAALGNLEAAKKVVVRRATQDTLTILGIRRR